MRLSISYANIVGVNHSGTALDYITPGDAQTSYIWHKMNNTQSSVGGSGGVMPTSGMLPQSDLDTVEAWINGGALEN